MARKKLTKTNIEEARHEGSAKAQFILWDTELAGFGCRIYPEAAGRSKRSFLILYRHGTKRRMLTIGDWPAMTPDEARTEARKLLAHRRDIDPAARRDAAKAAGVTLADAYEAYAKERKKPLRANTLRDYDRAMDSAFADWAGLPFSKITREMVAGRFERLTKNGPATANRHMRFLRALLNWATERYRPEGQEPASNPVQSLSRLKKWNASPARNRLMDPERFPGFFQATAARPDATKQERDAADFAVFVLLSAARFSEAAGLTWNDVDLRRRVVCFRETKNGKLHELPIGPWLAARLTTRSAAEPLVFAGMASNGRRELGKLFARIGLELSAHDLRRTFATVGALVVKWPELKRLMNHAPGADVTGKHYVALTAADVRPAMEAIENRMLALAGLAPAVSGIPADRTAEVCAKIGRTLAELVVNESYHTDALDAWADIAAAEQPASEAGEFLRRVSAQ